jgi:hypothetical protein
MPDKEALVENADNRSAGEDAENRNGKAANKFSQRRQKLRLPPGQEPEETPDPRADGTSQDRPTGFREGR